MPAAVVPFESSITKAEQTRPNMATHTHTHVACPPGRVLERA